jgi:cytochrome c biogenesis protein CcmG, thiol:disulfide interchange protein DsbE
VPDPPAAPARIRRTQPRRVVVALGIGCLLAVAVAGVFLALRPRPESTSLDAPLISDRPVGAPLPVDFRLARLGGGPPVELATLVKGKPAVINLFASWCSACEKELRAFGRVSSELKGRVSFVGVDTSEPSPGRSLLLLRQAGARYPVALDSSSSEVADAWGVADLPVTFYLRPNGTIAKEVLGAEDSSVLRAAAEGLLSSPG